MKYSDSTYPPEIVGPPEISERLADLCGERGVEPVTPPGFEH